jgi:hypothetical protein
MLGDELPVTGLVATVNVAEDEPAKTVTLEGTVAAEVLFDNRLIIAPPVGAAALIVTVTCEEAPPTTLIGLSEIEETVTGAARTASVATWLLELREAEILDEEFIATGWVEIVNVAEDEPAKTVTLEGTVAAAVLLDKSVTIAPPVGAAPLRATVACEDVPPEMLDGLSNTENTSGGVTLNVAALLVEL